MNKRILLLGIISMLVLVGCTELENKERELNQYCKNNMKDHNCDQLLVCYDACSSEDWITHVDACRESYKPRLWRCFGGSMTNE